MIFRNKRPRDAYAISSRPGARHGFQVALALVTLVALALAPLPAPAMADPIVRTDWPTPRFIPEGTGFNPYETVLSPSTVGHLELAWSVETEGSLFTTPIVVDGVVYVAGHIGLTGGAGLYAYDAASGDLLWSRRDGGQPPSDLTVWDGKIYASYLTDHVLRAFEAATGDLLWEVSGPTMAPTVVDGVVYAADNLRSLWAFDARTGRKRWVAHAPLGGFGFGLAVADGTIYVGGDEIDGTSPVYAYDAATGALVWRSKTRGGVLGTPAVAEGKVYVGSGDDFLYALDAQTGSVRWRATTGSGIASSAAVAKRAVYVGSADTNVYAFHAQTGEQLWVSRTGGIINAAQAAIVANGVVYIGSGDGKEYAFHAVTGQQLWSFQTEGGVYKQSVVDGTLYVTSFDANLYAFRLPGQDPS